MNGNGLIDSGEELFGNRTKMSDGSRAENGFAALSQYDANGDGAITSGDPVWSRLRIWIDGNHDGVSQWGELYPLESLGVTSLGFDFHTSRRHDKFGNVFRFESHFKEDGKTKPYYDVDFVHQ